MKALVTATTRFGPFAVIEVAEGKYHCDGVDYPFSVVGECEIVEWVPPTPTKSADELRAEVTEATQQRLDAFARTRNYDGILSACTYATSAVTQFSTEGQYCVTARDATWAKLYEILCEVEAGTRAMPAGFVDIESALPALEWPL